ncbi:MAG: hypothetical protein ACI959_001818, partial [Limisphaerales bacterium]
MNTLHNCVFWLLFSLAFVCNGQNQNNNAFSSIKIASFSNLIDAKDPIQALSNVDNFLSAERGISHVLINGDISKQG